MHNIHYKIQAASPTEHLFKVELTLKNPDPNGQTLLLPAWIPGSYMIRDFAKNVVSLYAHSHNQLIKLKKINKSTWLCPPLNGPLTVVYEVYAWDLSVRGAHLDTTHGFFNGASVFLCPVGLEDHMCSVEILAPEGNNYQEWKVATSMPRLTAKEHGFGMYQASNYDELIDHPVEMGCFTLVAFYAGEIKHEIAVTGKHRANMERIAQDLKKVCEYFIRFFGLPAPMEYYLFLVMALHKGGYGGLEHRASCTCHIAREDLPTSVHQIMDDHYINFLNLCSHEYFHTWNVKRIKPEAFMPYDLSQESYTEQLWVFEGFTAYYQDLVLIRTEIISPEQYLKLLAETCTKVWRLPGRKKQTVTESSYDAWIKFYKQDENAPNAIISYYTKGAVIALALDLKLRLLTNNQYSLDDVVKKLWQDYGKKNKGLPEGRVIEIIESFGDETIRTFLQKALYSTDDLDLKTLFHEFGIEFSLRIPSSLKEKGGIKTKEDNLTKVSLGITAVPSEAGIRVQTVFTDSCAQKAGISSGDSLISINHIKLDNKAWETQVAQYEKGDNVIIHAFRRDELMSFEVTLDFIPTYICELSFADEPTPKMLENRFKWLH